MPTTYRFFIFLLGCFILYAGCAPVRTFKKDYLQADEFSGKKMTEAMDTIKKDYLGIEETSLDRKRKDDLVFVAKKHLMNTNYVNDYEMATGVIDEELSMPEASGYIFIHFKPLLEREDIKDTVYLVVLNRLNDQIEYTGVFRAPGGDPMYRYAEILGIIQHPSSSPTP